MRGPFSRDTVPCRAMQNPKPENMPDDKPFAGPPQNNWLALLNLGWVFLVTMGVTVFGGVWLDKKFGCAPIFILIGVFLGFSISGYYFYQTLKKMDDSPP